MNTDFPGSDITDLDYPPADPIALLQQWIPPHSTPVMALATSTPNIRHVLASEVTSGGISFHTTSESAKVREIAADPHVAASFVWPHHCKQLIVQGTVEQQPHDEAAAVYHQRSRYLQLLAHLNTDELARKPSTERKRIWDEFAQGPTPEGPPDNWRGYVLVPTRISFWRAVSDVPSNRHDYYLRNGAWQLDVVAG